jgi:hypothetical protein
MSNIYWLLAAVVAIAMFYVTLKEYGAAQYGRGVIAGELKAAERFIIGKEKLDEIADDKPDDAMLIMRLREGSFFPPDP